MGMGMVTGGPETGIWDPNANAALESIKRRMRRGPRPALSPNGHLMSCERTRKAPAFGVPPKAQQQKSRCDDNRGQEQQLDRQQSRQQLHSFAHKLCALLVTYTPREPGLRVYWHSKRKYRKT